MGVFEYFLAKTRKNTQFAQLVTVEIPFYSVKLYNVKCMNEEILKQLNFLKKTLPELRASLRHNNGKIWTQQDVANKLGIRYQSYQAYESGKAVPSLQNFLKLAELFDVSLDYLVGRKDY